MSPTVLAVLWGRVSPVMACSSIMNISAQSGAISSSMSHMSLYWQLQAPSDDSMASIFSTATTHNNTLKHCFHQHVSACVCVCTLWCKSNCRLNSKALKCIYCPPYSSSPQWATSAGPCSPGGGEEDRAGLTDMTGCRAAPSQTAAPPPPSDRKECRRTESSGHRWQPSPEPETTALCRAPPTQTRRESFYFSY